MAVLYEKYSPPDKLYEQIKLLPDLPGVYQFVNTDDKIIYIGKAKNLKKRVSSYFNKNFYFLIGKQRWTTKEWKTID